jgi:hypothetical protein
MRHPAGGPHNSYAAETWHLTNALGSQQPCDVDLDDWVEEVEKLEELVIADDDDGVWGWFREHYPRCMALVPTRRRDQFVAGVKQAREDGRLCV